MEPAGPALSPDEAIDLLSRARHRDDIFSIVLQGALTRARRALLLTVRGEVAMGRFAAGEGATDPDAIANIAVPLEQAEPLQQALLATTPVVGSLASVEGAAADALVRMGIDLDEPALLMPIRVGERVVALVLGACRPGVDDAADLAPLAEAGADAVVRLIMRTKARATTVDGEPTSRLAEQADLYRQNEMWEELAGVLRDQIDEAAGDAEKAALYKRLGHVLTTRLGRDADAVEAWSKAAELSGEYVETRRALLRLYRRLRKWEELAGMLRQVLDADEGDEPLSADEQIQLLAELGDVEGNVLDQAPRAIDAWQRLLAIDATDARAMDALEQLYAREERWDDCATLLERRAALADDEGAGVYTLLQLADVLERHLDAPERAVDAYQRVLSRDPQSAIAGERLPALLRQLGRWDELAAGLVDRAEHCDAPGERIDVLLELARIYETELAQPEAAVVVVQTAFGEDTTDEVLAGELARLATETESWATVLADCAARAERLDDEDPYRAHALWLRLGVWYEEQLGNLDGAIDAVERALRIEPADPAALEALQELQENRASWVGVAATLQKRAELTSGAERADLAIALGRVHEEHLDDTAQAIAAYESALADDPTSERAITALARLYRWNERWHDLVALLRRGLDIHDSGELGELARLRVELGEVLRDRLGAQTEAIDAFRDALDVDPTNQTALAALEALYEGTEQPVEYLEVLEAQIDTSEPREERAGKYLAAAAAWDEQFGRVDRALACVERALEIDDADEDALAALARLHGKLGDWDAARDAYRALAAATSAPQRRVDVLVKLAEVCERELDAPGEALAAFDEAQMIDPIDERVLAGVGRLCEGDPATQQRAAGALELLLKAALEPPDRAELHCRLGRIAAARGDTGRAQQHFTSALADDETHLPAVDGIVEICEQRGDWETAVEALAKAARTVAWPADRVRLLTRAAELYRDRLDDPGRAMACYAAVMELDPESTDVAAPLAELYFAAQHWEPLAPVLALLIRRGERERGGGVELGQLHYRAAICAAALGDTDRAADHYERAFAADPTSVPMLIGRANLLFERAQWDDAARAYQRLAIQHAHAISQEQAADVYYRIGVARRELGETRKAAGMFEKAIALDGAHRDALAALIDIDTARGDHDAVIRHKRRMAAGAGPDEQVRLLDQIAALYRDELDNPQRELAAYLEALEIKPQDHQLLQRVLERYTEAGQWRRAVDTIHKFLDIESNAQRRGRYYLAAAAIAREKLREPDEALEYFEAALDSFFEDPDVTGAALERGLEAFRAVDEMLTEQKAWKQQERAYRRMIERAAHKRELSIALWDGLTEVYRSRLDQPQSAIEAAEVAQSLAPDDTERRKRLAQLYLVVGEQSPEKAAEQHQRILQTRPDAIDSYRMLGGIYLNTDQRDRAWCASAALSFLGQATREEQEFYDRHRPKGLVQARGHLTEDIWRALHHPSENRFITAIFAAIWQGPARLRAAPHKAAGLRRKDRVDLAADDRTVSRVIEYVAGVLQCRVPDVYYQPDKPGGLLLANCVDGDDVIPSLVVRADILNMPSRRVLAFAVGRMLALMRPEHYLRLALATKTERKVALLSAVKLVAPEFPVPPDLRAGVAQYLPAMQRHVSPSMHEQLGHVVTRLIAAAPELHVDAWDRGADATARRAGFVVSGDLAAAAAVIASEPTGVGEPGAKQKTMDLVAYSVSEDYFALREQLGLAVA
jgi:tetratricopeptide (TPR) repeat protein